MQQRDVGNEIMVAIVVIAVLAFAIAFSVILSLTTGETTPTAVAGQNTSTNTELPATTAEQPSVTITATPTETTTNTATQAATTQPTNTRRPTRTPEPTETPTNTRGAPTRTSRPTMTPTDRPSLTHTPTRRPTRTPTLTPIQAGFTVEPTQTPPANAITPSPMTASGDIGIIPTPTGGFTAPVLTLPPPTGACVSVPAGWTTYTVQTGNTLFSIALAVRSSVPELLRVNCLSDADRIFAGQVLYVPRAPEGVVGVGVPAVGRNDCRNPAQAQINVPSAGARVSSVFSVSGTAALNNFWYYRIEIRPDASQTYNFWSRGETAIQNGELTQIDSTLFSDGLYWVRLSIIDLTGGIPFDAICTVPVYIEN